MYWGRGGCQCVGASHADMHTHACMLNMINVDASMRVAICNFYTCASVHVHMCGADAPTHLPSPQEPHGAQNTKIQKVLN